MTPSPEDLWRAVLPVVDSLEQLGTPYYIGGSVASSYIGVSRATMDADLVAALNPRRAEAFHRSLGSAYYADLERIESAARRRRSFNLIHLESAFKLDIFVPPDSPFTAMNFARRTTIEVPEIARALYFASPEDIVLHKLQWYASGGGVSDRQWSDLGGILRLRQSTLDLAYLRAWAEKLELEMLLKKAMAEAGYGSSPPLY